MIGLIDGDNFFVSCERVRDPSLLNKPVVVLSNNDGCVISRSNEVKALGVKMGEPYFKVKRLLEQHHVHVFSSSFQHYAELSRQLTTQLRSFSPRVEVYSVDEAFIELTGFERRNLTDYSRQMAQSILDTCRIPVSIGIAPTKTLAKAAAEFAKKQPKNQHILVFDNAVQAQAYLSELPIGDVWGVGWKLQAKLEQMGIHTAKSLVEASSTQILKRFGTMLARTQAELQGIKCYDVITEQAQRKSLMFSRSFSSPVTQYKDMRQVLSLYTAKAAEKLRHDSMCAGYIGVEIMTSRFVSEEHHMRQYLGLNLSAPSDCTHTLNKLAQEILKQIFISNYPYKKACLYLGNLVPVEGRQQSLFESVEVQHKNTALMETLDTINEQFGRGSLRYAGEGFERPWQSRREHAEQQESEPYKSLEGLRFL